MATWIEAPQQIVVRDDSLLQFLDRITSLTYSGFFETPVGPERRHTAISGWLSQRDMVIVTSDTTYLLKF